MQSNREIPGSPGEWLARARSSLALAKAKKPEATMWEDLCFCAQQAAEKALKGVLQRKRIRFRYVHDLEELVTALERAGVDVPEDVRQATGLT